MFLSNFRSVSPGSTYSQDELLEKLASLYLNRTTESAATDWPALFRKFGCKAESIRQRCAVIMSYLSERTELPNLLDRQRIFQQVVTEYLPRVVDETVATDEIFHVSCTGYVSPSVAQILVSKNETWKKSVATHLYHMGCYASIPAIRLARGALSLQVSASIKILHTELCTLHFGYSDEPQNWVTQSLFADGIIAYDALKSMPESSSFEVLATLEEIVPDSIDKMSWIPAEDRFRMTLSRDVPKYIGSGITGFVERLLAAAFENRKSDFEFEALKNAPIFYAIHPGGPKILEEVSSTLKLEARQWQTSRDVFYNNGNMSSATLPTIWSNLLADQSVISGSLVVSLAFGPGLTFAGSVFRLVR